MRTPAFLKTQAGGSAAFLCLLLLLSLNVAGCGPSSGVGGISSGRVITYQPGVPNFDMEAIASWRDGQPGIDLHYAVPFRSLSFTRAPSGYAAAFSTTVRVIDMEREQEILERYWIDSMVTQGYDETRQFNSFGFSRRLPIAPGKYRLDAVLLDLNSNKRALRSQEVDVFSLDTLHPTATRLWIARRIDGDSTVPVVTFNLQSDMDSLRAYSVVYNAHAVQGAVAQWLIVRVASDTSASVAPYLYQSTRTSLMYRGVDFDQRDTVFSERIAIAGDSKEATLEWSIPRLEQGVYELEQTLQFRSTSLQPEVQLIRRRYDVAVRGAGFPRPSTLDQLVEPLSYLAREDEYQTIVKAATPQAKRKQFELFWLKLGGSEEKAADLIRQYYTRVEETNLLFTTFKEGWKTDRGMVYIILGPPVTVGAQVGVEVWYYGYDEQDPYNTYVFERVRDADAAVAFPNFILRRQQYYSVGWDRVVQRWRRGMIQ